MAVSLPSTTGPSPAPACLSQNIFEKALHVRQARRRSPTGMLEDDAGCDLDQSLGSPISVLKASKRRCRESSNLLCHITGLGSKRVKAGDKVLPEQYQKIGNRIGSQLADAYQPEGSAQRQAVAMRAAPEANSLLHSRVPLPEPIPAVGSLYRSVGASKRRDPRSLAQFGQWGAPIVVSITATKAETGAAGKKLRWMAEQVALASVINSFSTELMEEKIARYLVRAGKASMRKLAEELGLLVNFASQQQFGGGVGQGTTGGTISNMEGETRKHDEAQTDLSQKIYTATHANHEILIPTACAAMVGFASGATTSSKLSGYQFMVENLHRIPKTRSDWYFFQKTKNYKMILGGFRGGLKVGAKLGAWTAAFCSLKEGLSLSPLLEDRKSVAGGLSGFGIALGAGLFYRLQPLMSPRRLLLGGLLGFCAGAAEEAKNMLVKDQPSL